jgi:hypothetical protein
MKTIQGEEERHIKGISISSLFNKQLRMLLLPLPSKMAQEQGFSHKIFQNHEEYVGEVKVSQSMPKEIRM